MNFHDVPFGAIVLFVIAFAVIFSVGVLLKNGWTDPLNFEKRAIRRRQKKQRVFVRNLQRPSHHADRAWYKEFT